MLAAKQLHCDSNIQLFMTSPIVGQESILVVRQVPVGERGLVLVDGKFRLSKVGVSVAITYPAPMLVGFGAIAVGIASRASLLFGGGGALKSGQAFLRRPALLLSMAAVVLIFVLSGRPETRNAVFAISTARRMEIKPLAQVSQQQSEIAPRVPPQHQPLAAGVAVAGKQEPTSAPYAAVKAAFATAQQDESRTRLPATAQPPTSVTSAVPPVPEPALMPRYPVPSIIKRSPFDAAPLQLPTNTQSNSHFPYASTAAGKTYDQAATQDTTPAIDVEIRTDQRLLPAKPLAIDAIEGTPDYRPITTNDDALVIRMGNGIFKEIRPGQQLPGGATLKSVAPAGDSYKTDVGTFNFSIKGQPKK